MRRLATVGVGSVLASNVVYAHCPLCTIGAGAAAGTAAYFGVAASVLGVFIGAFAVAVGLWFARVLPRKIPLQNTLLVLGSFLLTVWPLNPLLAGYSPLYLPIGEYGTTLAVNMYVVGSILGAALVLVSPRISDWLTDVREKKFPYQTMTLTFLLLIIAAGVLQVIV